MSLLWAVFFVLVVCLLVILWVNSRRDYYGPIDQAELDVYDRNGRRKSRR